MLAKNSFCSSQSGSVLSSNPLKGSSTMDNDKKISKTSKAFEKTQIQIKNQTLDDFLQVYGWRSKTQLPIAKVMFYKVVSKESNDQFTTVEVSYQSFPTTLADMKEIAIQNVIYLLKESMIGFEKLFGVFGSFLISNKMIGINKNNRCKVWINQNFSINEPIDVQIFKNLNEKTFLDQILSIYQKKCEKSKKSQILFKDLNQLQTFQHIVTAIQMFSKKYSIEIGISLKIQQRQERKDMVSKSPIRNANQMTSNSFIGNQSKQFPKFLNKSQMNDVENPRQLISKIQQQREKSRSVSRSNIRARTPLNHNKSQIGFHNPLKNTGVTASYIPKKQAKQSVNDYSFEIKNNKGTAKNEDRKNKHLATSTNSLSYQDVQEIFEGKTGLNSQKKFEQLNQVTKSDLNTAHTSNSNIPIGFKNMILKKNSLFDDEDRNMLQSIVAGQQHERPRKSMHSTFDLEKLGKLGKHIGQSYMPEDF